MDSDPYGKWVEEVRFSSRQDEGTGLPPGHTEGTAYAEDPTPENAARDVYDNEDLFGPGLRKAWDDLTPGEDSRESFVGTYSTYCENPEQLRQEQPERHDFVREHVFYGAEPTSVKFGGGYSGRFDVEGAQSDKGNRVVSDASGNLFDRETGEGLSKY